MKLFRNVRAFWGGVSEFAHIMAVADKFSGSLEGLIDLAERRRPYSRVYDWRTVMPPSGMAGE